MRFEKYLTEKDIKTTPIENAIIKGIERYGFFFDEKTKKSLEFISNGGSTYDQAKKAISKIKSAYKEIKKTNITEVEDEYVIEIILK